jgi:hypothetical protein
MACLDLTAVRFPQDEDGTVTVVDWTMKYGPKVNRESSRMTEEDCTRSD